MKAIISAERMSKSFSFKYKRSYTHDGTVAFAPTHKACESPQKYATVARFHTIKCIYKRKCMYERVCVYIYAQSRLNEIARCSSSRSPL